MNDIHAILKRLRDPSLWEDNIDEQTAGVIADDIERLFNRGIITDGRELIAETDPFEELRQAASEVKENSPIVFAPKPTVMAAIERYDELVNESNERTEQLLERIDELTRHFLSTTNIPIPMLLQCPSCFVEHFDVGEWATRPHRTHKCVNCGHNWRPANIPTVGVDKLPAV